MRFSRILSLGLVAFLAACASESTAPAAAGTADDLAVDLSSQFESTRGAAIDQAGIGGVEFPDSLKLTAEQKAQIEALHAAFERANAADLAALKAIEKEVRDAIKAGKTRQEVARIMEKAAPIRGRLAAAMAKLAADIWKVYTPAQQAWLTARRRGDVGECRPEAALATLSAAQVEQVRALKARFAETVKVHLETIKKVHEEARAARQAGASAEEVRKILSRADAAMTEVQKAERALKESILALLTPDQRNNRCLLRVLLG